MNSEYRDPIIQKIIDVLEPLGPSRLVGRYVNGDVLLPNESELPMCYIAKDTTVSQPADNMEDEHLQSIVATVIYSANESLNGLYDQVAGTPELYEMMEGRTDDYLLKHDTLLYFATKNQQLDDKLWIGVGNQSGGNNAVAVNYGLGVNRRGPNIFSVEATMRFTVRLHLPNPEYY
jgi:hypothetical protein